MPHINIKSYPKGLTETQLQDFANELTALASKHLNTPAEYISIDYTAVPEDEWKEKVYDTEIKPNRAHLLKQPQYEM